MSRNNQAREEWLLHILERDKDWWNEQISSYRNMYHQINRGSSLSTLAELSIQKGLKSFFVEKEISDMKQHFYVACKLKQKSQCEGWDTFAAYHPFLYGLLSDSPEIYDWLAHAEIKNNDYVKGWSFRLHQFQLVLRKDDAALRETIALVAKKGGNRDKDQAAAGTDSFSLLLKCDKEALQTFIENTAKIKSASEFLGQFLAGYAVILAKLCWFRGIEVEIKNSLVPMPLMPIKPLDAYDVEYDFLHPGWIPSQPSLMEKMMRWFT
jgi:hypothetical protein